MTANVSYRCNDGIMLNIIYSIVRSRAGDYHKALHSKLRRTDSMSKEAHDMKPVKPLRTPQRLIPCSTNIPPHFEIES